MRRRTLRDVSRLGASGVLAGVDDLEVLADQDLELVAGARGDGGLVGSAGVAVGLRAQDLGAGVLGQHCGLDLLLRVTGQRGLARAGTAAAAAVIALAAATAGRLGLDRRRLEGGVDEHDALRAGRGLDVGVVRRGVGAAGLRASTVAPGTFSSAAM